MCFVTSRIANSPEFDYEMADYIYIKRCMQKAGWSWRRSWSFDIREAGEEIPMMFSLWFEKKGSS
jgi:hypothetical protein